MNVSKLRTGASRLYYVMPLVISLLFTPTGDADGTGITAGPQATSDIQIVYVANAGFLVIVDGKKILIDALFALTPPEEPPREVLQRLETGQAPFDSLDLILATHNDPDHFRAESVLRALAHNSNAVFLSTPQALSELETHSAAFTPVQDRILRVDLPADSSAQMEIRGLTIRIMSTNHGGSAWVQNYMYLVSSSSGSIFHEGDAEVIRVLDRHDFGADSIDVAFVQTGLLTRPEFLRRIEGVLKPRHLIPMHITAAKREYADEMLGPLVRTRNNVHYLRDCLESITIPGR
jgi:L-ascorbate metabolism protein UlaG (beta-lactamase superfamily)